MKKKIMAGLVLGLTSVALMSCEPKIEWLKSDTR